MSGVLYAFETYEKIGGAKDFVEQCGRALQEADPTTKDLSDGYHPPGLTVRSSAQYAT